MQKNELLWHTFAIELDITSFMTPHESDKLSKCCLGGSSKFKTGQMACKPPPQPFSLCHMYLRARVTVTETALTASGRGWRALGRVERVTEMEREPGSERGTEACRAAALYNPILAHYTMYRGLFPPLLHGNYFPAQR